MSEAPGPGGEIQAAAGRAAAARAWVLNFDADEELAAPRGYTPSAAVRARFADLAGRVGPLLADGDLLLADGDLLHARRAIGLEGRAFCPTPRALAALAAAGAQLPAAPPAEVLRHVNDRAFHASLGLGLPGAAFVETIDEALAVLAAPCPTDRWLVKRAFGFAGRGRRAFAAGTVDAAGRAWLVRATAIAGAGLEIEPLCDRIADFAMHGFLGDGGGLTLGEPTAQVIDKTGAWQATRRARPEDLEPAERDALAREAHRTAEALLAAGYFGPFGIDAFRWHGPGGQPRFHPRCDVNARYTMGWAVGMGAARPDLLRAVT